MVMYFTQLQPCLTAHDTLAFILSSYKFISYEVVARTSEEILHKCNSLEQSHSLLKALCQHYIVRAVTINCHSPFYRTLKMAEKSQRSTNMLESMEDFFCFPSLFSCMFEQQYNSVTLLLQSLLL